jgi:hypothetical protein
MSRRMKDRRAPLQMFTPMLAVAVAAGFLGCGVAHAHEAAAEKHEGFDTEHIFGFTEGADIGEKGEKEIESATVAAFGKPGRYLALGNDTAFRYVLTDALRVSAGTLLDYHYVGNVPELPNRDAFNFAGLTTEVRWHPVQRTAAQPVGLSFALMPEWRRIEETSGATVETYAAPVEMLIDVEPIRNKLFGAINVVYEPSVTRVNGGWEHENSLEISAAVAYALTNDLTVGAEIRHLSTGQRGLFEAEAVFAGPSVYYRFSENFSVKFAWSEQIPDESTGRLDTVNFERHQALLLLVKSF